MSKRTAGVPTNRYPNTLPPSGPPTATCCPKYAGLPKWWGAPGEVTSRQASVRGWTVDPIRPVPTRFGWDDRTNLPEPEDRGTQEYWLKPGGPGSAGGRRDKDGSVWVSVEKGSTANVELKFVGQAGAGCIQNVSLDIDDTSKVTATPSAFAAASVNLTITGVADGECTIKLKCNGADIGWCHVAVYTRKTANVSVFRVHLQDAAGNDLTDATALTGADITSFKTELENVYGQCAVRWNVTNGGKFTYTTPRSVNAYRATLQVNERPRGARLSRLFSDVAAANPAAAAAPAMNIYYLEPLVFGARFAGYSNSGGVVNGIPSNDVLIYAPPTGRWGMELLAHELGHCLGLFHPNDRRSTGQLFDNFRLPLVNNPSGSGRMNCMYSDHINLMGYGADRSPNSSMRYGQWKTVQARL